MSEGNPRQLRVLHLVSSNGVSEHMQQSLFMPLLTKLPKQRVKLEVVCMSPDAIPATVLRQNGIPVHDLALSRRRFSAGAVGELLRLAREFRPDVIQAWGHTAQIVAISLRARCDWQPRVVVSATGTAPLARRAGLIDRQKLKFAARFAAKANRIVFSSHAAASAHARVGYPRQGHAVIAPGIDALRFKPDLNARQKIRKQLGLAPEDFVIGMVAPFQNEYDHTTLCKALGELIKTNPNLHLLLAGHGVQKGNASLMALIGSGALAGHTRLLGEWSDTATLFNACDVACSTALIDTASMTVAMAMLCGVPCVATAMGEQSEVIGQFGIAIESGSPAAVIRGITRILQMPAARRAFMVKAARKHAMQNFVHVHSLQKYLQLYFELAGRETLAIAEAPPQIDVPVPVPATHRPAPATPELVMLETLTNHDSLEAQAQAVCDWKPPPLPVQPLPQPEPEGDVLQAFENTIAQSKVPGRYAGEMARGVADEGEDLLSPELLSANPGEEFRPRHTQGAGAAKPKAIAVARVPGTAAKARLAAAGVAAGSVNAAPAPARQSSMPERSSGAPAIAADAFEPQAAETITDCAAARLLLGDTDTVLTEIMASADAETVRIDAASIREISPSETAAAPIKASTEVAIAAANNQPEPPSQLKPVSDGSQRRLAGGSG